jgi:hypothetical protein
MENNPELTLAWQFVTNTGANLFLTGKAGTGKTTFLRTLKENCSKRMVVLAPTGIAAINAKGVTIHSFFQFPLAPFIPDPTFNSHPFRYSFSKEKLNIIRSMDLLVIDEISMVRADLLDEVDAVLRRYREWDKPFGGVQLLMLGDVQQLAPVARDEDWQLLKDYYDTPYFFGSHALRDCPYMTIELKNVYRQQDTHFLSLLNKIRTNTAHQSDLDELNKRYIPHFTPKDSDGYIRLTTHNYQARNINERELDALKGQAYSFDAEVEGDFPNFSFPTEEHLVVKEGAQVMFVKNDSSTEKRYYNGMIGEVTGVGEEKIWVRSRDTGAQFELEKEVWSNAKYALDKASGSIVEEVKGTFTQYPIRLAWAITIHKSQGLTFDRAIIDAGNAFAHGQTYVALSRCRTLDGIVLEEPLRPDAIITDRQVDDFTRQSEQRVPDSRKMQELERAYVLELLHELFGLHDIERTYSLLLRLLEEHLYKLYPETMNEYKQYTGFFNTMNGVAARFEMQYTQLFDRSGCHIEDEELQRRIHAASAYFEEQLTPLHALYQRTTLQSDNKDIARRIKERMTDFGNALLMKLHLYKYLKIDGVVFTPELYLKMKAKEILNQGKNGESKREKKERTPKAKTKVDVPTDIQNEELYDRLREWRYAKAQEMKIPAYCVVHQKALMAVANLMPRTAAELTPIPYLGKRGIAKYGEEMLDIVAKYCDTHR